MLWSLVNRLILIKLSAGWSVGVIIDCKGKMPRNKKHLLIPNKKESLLIMISGDSGVMRKGKRNQKLTDHKI